jgi:hypothetical protein
MSSEINGSIHRKYCLGQEWWKVKSSARLQTILTPGNTIRGFVGWKSFRCE